jgi:hypothetical protein
MASFSPLRATSRPHSRHRYQMVPSKDDALRVIYSPDESPENEHGDAFNGIREDESLSWKKQALVDLKSSRHRDTSVTDF